MARADKGHRAKQLEPGTNFPVKLPVDGEDAHLLVSILNQQKNRNKFVLESLLMRASSNRIKRAGEPIVINVPSNEDRATMIWLNTQENLDEEIMALIREKARRALQILQQGGIEQRSHEPAGHTPSEEKKHHEIKVDPVVESIRGSDDNGKSHNISPVGASDNKNDDDSDDELM